jgi:hypothetical protein
MSRSRSRVQQGLAATAATVLTACVVGAPPASAAEPVVVNMGDGCAFNDDGSTTAPAGVPLQLRPFGFGQGTYGLIRAFLVKQVTTLVITDSTGTHEVDISDTYPAPLKVDERLWVARPSNYDLGTLADGESVSIGLKWEFTTPLLIAYPPVGPTGDNGPFLSYADGDGTFTCTITGVAG